ncbi:MAG TPA: hypothetical protein VJ600_00890 [Holophagaceae bacterium]|nr:hypothetical protein [Holophagaceae bacterium]
MPTNPKTWRERYRYEEGKVCVDLRLRHERQLFDARDPAPFRERDLDDDAVEWILDSLEELPRGMPFKIVMHFAEGPGSMAPDAIRESIRAHFAYEIRRLHRLRRRELQDGVFFLILACLILVACLGLSVLARRHGGSAMGLVLGEGLPIVGWVAMWRPLELFFYDGWPIRRRVRLCLLALESEIEI